MRACAGESPAAGRPFRAEVVVLRKEVFLDQVLFRRLERDQRAAFRPEFLDRRNEGTAGLVEGGLEGGVVDYEASPLEIDAAVDHLLAASRRMDRTAWAFAELRRLVNREGRTDLMTERLRLKLKMIEDDYDRA